ncbi:hypothetical protein BX616_001480, partial [Lobosporangium transversale]
MLLDSIFEDKSDVKTTNDPPSSSSSASSSSFLTHTFMYQALNVSEITYIIRRELRGHDLKTMVLVNRLWWKAFGPYLWENIYIDANPEQDDRQIIFRNGLAAKRLTLSIYDPQDTRGTVSYVAERCQNVSELHLKLFSPSLVDVDAIVMLKGDGNPSLGKPFGLQHETRTTLLDSLLTKLPFITDLTISLADEKLKPEVLWCVTKISRLQRLTVNGGLPTKNYILRRNWSCSWDLLMQVARECPTLDSLSVAWESRRLIDTIPDIQDVVLENMREMYFAIEGIQEMTDNTPTVTSIPLPVPSLKRLDISCCETYDGLLDQILQSCSNLREVTFQSVKTIAGTLDNCIQTLTIFCSRLRAFSFEPATDDDSDYSKVLLDGPLLNIPCLKLSLGRVSLDSIQSVGLRWDGAHSITVLDISINNYMFLFKLMTTMTGLEHLTLRGSLYGVSCESHEDLLKYFENEKVPYLALPEFASQSTLKSLNLTQLEFGSLKCHQLFFDRVQRLPQLRQLELSHRQVQDARLEETWMDLGDPQMSSDITQGRTGYPYTIFSPATIKIRRRPNYNMYGVAYANTLDSGYGPENELRTMYYTPTWVADQQQQLQYDDVERIVNLIPDKTFRHFPAVEFLYIYDDSPTYNFIKEEHYLSEHMASALVQMMPKLKVMAFDRSL